MKIIVCYGDSNTHGTLPMATIDDDGRLGPNERWPGVMAAELGTGFRVIEEGLPGRTTVQDDPFEGVHLNGLRILPAILNSHRPIDGLIIMLGTNDLKARFSAPAADIALGVEKLALLAATLAHPPRVLIVAPAPVREIGCLANYFAGAEAKGAGLTDALRYRAGRVGADFFNAGSVISVDPLDGVHFGAGAVRHRTAARRHAQLP
ncbi:MAG: hydrolase [Rhodobacteraceae bacterium]|nr:hydrolase [Paracoccaceae bacterium]